jgi:hypothetical protein
MPTAGWCRTCQRHCLDSPGSGAGVSPGTVTRWRHTALPKWLGWFGLPGSMPTIGIVVTVLIAVCVLTFWSDSSHRLVGVSFTVIAVLITMSAVLGLSSYWGCHDANHLAFLRR